MGTPTASAATRAPGVPVASAKGPKRKPRAAKPPPVAREAKDIVLKWLASHLQGRFLEGLGLDLPAIAAVLPAELPLLTVRAEHPDLLFMAVDGTILHPEFQTTLDPEGLRRFSRYSFAASEEYRTEVYTIVFYGPGIEEAPDTLRRGSHTFVVRNVFLGRLDGEAVVARLRERIAAGESPSEDERTRLKLLPLLGQSRPLPEVLAEVAGLARSLPRAEREDIIGTMVGLAYNYVEPGFAGQLLEVLTMANALESLIADTLVRGRVEGKAEGKAEGIAEGVAVGKAEGIAVGRQEAILALLSERLGPLPDALRAEIAPIVDGPTLGRLLLAASTAATVEGFRRTLRNPDA